jgi:hypothetical protein
MPYDAILNAEIGVGDPAKQSIWQKIKDNQDFFNGLIGQFNTLDVANGSMEADADADDVPDNWTWTAHPGGSKSIVTGIEGEFAFQSTAPSGGTNGGGTLDSDFFPVPQYSNGGWRWLSWMMKPSAALGIKVTIRAYTDAKVFISERDVFDATDAPTDWLRYFAGLGPLALPNTTRFIVIRLEGGTVGPGVAGNVQFDAVTMNLGAPTDWHDRTGWSGSPFTTTSGTYAEVGQMIFSSGSSDRIGGGECEIMVRGVVEMLSADGNIGGFARVDVASAVSNEMMTVIEDQATSNPTNTRTYHYSLLYVPDYEGTVDLSFKAHNDDSTTTITLIQTADDVYGNVIVDANP